MQLRVIEKKNEIKRKREERNERGRGERGNITRDKGKRVHSNLMIVINDKE